MSEIDDLERTLMYDPGPNRKRGPVKGFHYIAHANRNKTHCKWGHEFTPENIRRKKLRDGSYCRECRTCMKERRKEQYYKRKQAGIPLAKC